MPELALMGLTKHHGLHSKTSAYWKGLSREAF